MSTNDTRPNKGTVTGYSWKYLPAYEWLGTDRNGYDYVLDRKRDAVHRINLTTGQRTRVDDLYGAGDDDRADATETYVDFVAARVGWVDRTIINRDVFGDR